MTNFNPILNTNEKFLGEKYSRELMHDDIAWSTLNMSDEELRQVIIADLVSFLMWEKEKNTKLHITFEELVRFVHPSDVQRIKEQLEHIDIKHLFDFDGTTYRMKDNREILQAAMDLSGIWYEGYTPPDGEEVLGVDYEALGETIEKHGGVDNLAKALAMDLECTLPISTQLN